MTALMKADTCTSTVAVLVHPVLPVSVTVYSPDMYSGILLITGFCILLTQPAGPDQLKPPLPDAVNCTVDPSQVCVRLGLADNWGGVLMMMFSVDVAVHPFGLVTVRTYWPLFAAVTSLITGFCTLLVQPFGPVHA